MLGLPCDAVFHAGYQFRFFHVGDDQPVPGAGHGHIDKGYECILRCCSRADMIDTDEVNQFKIQPFVYENGVETINAGFPVQALLRSGALI